MSQENTNERKEVDIMSQTTHFNLDLLTENNLVSVVNGNLEKVDQALLDVQYTHPESGVTVGTYGDNTNTAESPAFGQIFSVPGFTVDKEGHITNANSRMFQMPSSLASTSAAGLMPAADKSKVNKIESGTWTPENLIGVTSRSRGYYRRFGDIVFVSGYMMTSSQNDLIIDNLPFTPAVNTEDFIYNKTDCIGQFTAYGGVKNNYGNTVYTGFVTTSSGFLRFYDDSYYGATSAGYCGNLTSDTPIIFSAIYKIGNNY